MRLYILPLLLLLPAFSFCQPLKNAPSADSVLAKAFRQASAENKKVLLMFHASWCVWCHRMDTSLNDPACRKFFNDNFVITHLTVDESADKKYLENTGADDLRKKYHGENLGIPFWLIFDKNGQLLADSKIRKPGEPEEKAQNIGCPASEEEVKTFIELLRKTTSLNQAALDIIYRRFRQNEH